MIVQEPISKLWITKGEISQLLDDGNSYLITTTDGQEIRRGLKLIRKLESPRASSPTDKQPQLKNPLNLQTEAASATQAERTIAAEM